MKISAIAVLLAAVFGSANSILPIIFPNPCGAYTLTPEYQWNLISYRTSSGTVTTNGSFITGLDTYGNTMFVSTPRGQRDVPATLATIPLRRGLFGSQSPLLEPYPNQDWNRLPQNPDGCSTSLVSVHRTARDKCNRLWVLDSGVIASASSPNREQVCPPKIVIFDLATNQMARVIEIPSSALTPISSLYNLVLDSEILYPDSSVPPTDSPCDNTFVYIADTSSPAIIVHRSPWESFYRLTSPYMYPDPDYPFHELNGEVFTRFDGIIGMDKVGAGSNGSVYFQAFGSRRVFSALTEVMQAGPFTDGSELPVTNVFNKTSEGIALHEDTSNGCVLFNPLSQNSIAAYSPRANSQRAMVASRQLALVFDITEEPANPRNKYLVSVQYPRYQAGTANNNEVNVRIFRFNRI